MQYEVFDKGENHSQELFDNENQKAEYMQTTNNAKRPSVEIPVLHGLRALAAAIVVATHYTDLSLNRFLGGIVVPPTGQIGVMLFFLISGLLMGHLYLPRKPDRNEILAFITRRAARIFPLYYFYIFISYPVNLVSPKHWPYPIYDLPSFLNHALFISGKWSLWTIPVEVQFYALFPLIWILLSKLEPPLKVVLILVITLLLIAFSTNNKNVPMILYCGCYFFAGILISLANNAKEQMLSRKNADVLFVLVSLATLINIFMLVSKFGQSMIGGSSFDLWKSVSLLVMLSCFVLTCQLSSFAENIFANKFARYLGDRSYSIYLAHVPVQIILQAWVIKYDPHLMVFIYLPLLMAVSELSYRFIENPARKWVNKAQTSSRSQTYSSSQTDNS